MDYDPKILRRNDVEHRVGEWLGAMRFDIEYKLGVKVLLIWNDVKMLGDIEAQTLFTQFSMKELDFFPYHRVKPSKTQSSMTDEELRKMFDIPYVFCR
ncbi:UNVERIFIED_CONTAM: hypothetical protein Sindi_1260200 [Sesamum indicum]